MKKIQLFFILTSFANISHAQSFFVSIGKNYTKINYKYKQVNTIDLHPDVGNTYELGVIFPIQYTNRFKYELGLQLNEFNAYIEAPVRAVTYNLQYLGINNSILVVVIDNNQDRKRFRLDLKGGVNIDKFVAGKQIILERVFDLGSFQEFKNVFISAKLGLHSRFVISEYIDLNVGYDRYMSFLNTGSTDFESLRFTSNQFKLGIHFQIN